MSFFKHKTVPVAAGGLLLAIWFSSCAGAQSFQPSAAQAVDGDSVSLVESDADVQPDLEQSDLASTQTASANQVESETVEKFRRFVGVYETLEDADFEQQQFAIAVEEYKLQCIRGQGFEYDMDVSRSTSSPGLTVEETRIRGFGLTTAVSADQPVRIVRVGDEEYLLSLSMDERMNYIEVYQTCENSAFAELGSQEVDLEDPLLVEVQDFVDEAVRSPEVGAVQSVWVDCMSGQGYAEFSDSGEAQNFIRSRLAQLAPGYPAGYEVGTEEGDNLRSRPDFLALQQDEIRIATAVRVCEDDFSAAWNAAMTLKVDEFLASNGDRLALLD